MDKEGVKGNSKDISGEIQRELGGYRELYRGESFEARTER